MRTISLFLILLLLLLAPPAVGEPEDVPNAVKRGIDSALKIRDTETHVELLKQLAEEYGSPGFQWAVGDAYFYGRGVQQDYREAAIWFRKAADGGESRAQKFLAIMYAMGWGIPKDTMQAYAWANLAAASGDADHGGETPVEDLREALAGSLTARQILKAQELSAEMWKKIEESKLLSRRQTAESDKALVGIPHVVDGDTLDIAGERVRLKGIDTPESAQRCRDAEGAEYSCGLRAKASLEARIGNGPVRCEIEQERDRYGRLIGICFAPDGADLNGWLVRNGWALAYRKYSIKYVQEEETAKAQGLGLHAGAFVSPWEWRKRTGKSH